MYQLGKEWSLMHENTKIECVNKIIKQKRFCVNGGT
jgi:hypothetical protein